MGNLFATASGDMRVRIWRYEEFDLDIPISPGKAAQASGSEHTVEPKDSTNSQRTV